MPHERRTPSRQVQSGSIASDAAFSDLAASTKTQLRASLMERCRLPAMQAAAYGLALKGWASCPAPVGYEQHHPGGRVATKVLKDGLVAIPHQRLRLSGGNPSSPSVEPFQIGSAPQHRHVGVARTNLACSRLQHPPSIALAPKLGAREHAADAERLEARPGVLDGSLYHGRLADEYSPLRRYHVRRVPSLPQVFLVSILALEREWPFDTHERHRLALQIRREVPLTIDFHFNHHWTYLPDIPDPSESYGTRIRMITLYASEPEGCSTD